MDELTRDHVALGEEIARLAARMNVATHRMLACIRDFDAAEGWHRQGAQSCAHWLTWRIGLNPGAAREKVRVARALGGLPALDRVFAEGRLSYAQVRAVTRIATPVNEQRVVDIAVAATGAQLERICRGFRKATQADEIHAAERSVRARLLGDGLVRLEVVLAADEAELVMKAIADARKQLSSETMKTDARLKAGEAPSSMVPAGGSAGTVGMPAARGAGTRATGAAEGPRVCAADALVHLASTFLMRGAQAAESTGDDALAAAPAASAASAGPRAEVVIHVSPDLVAGGANAGAGGLGATLEDGTNVSAETLRRAACDGGLVVAAVDQTGDVLDIGRRTRAIPTAIWRALLIRDHHCRFPGCTNRSFVHGHHIVHWLHGGRTALTNLVTLCSFHHRQIHEGGFEISLSPEMEVKVWTPDGRCLPGAPTFTADPGTVDWLAGEWDERDGESPAIDGPMPPPLWDGDRVDYEACVDSMMVS